MQFVYPTFLWALAAISIPIIIHLFNFRRYKKIVFSDIRFLQQLQEQNKSKQKLKDLLILLCRILAVSALVLAFAQPFLPIGELSKSGGQNTVSIFVDNSFSMNAQGSDGTLFEMAKIKARAIVNAFDNHDKFQIVTNQLSGTEQRLITKTEAINSIDAIEPTAASANITEINAKQSNAFGNQNGRYNHAFYISDFQKSQFNLGLINADSNITYNFIPIENKSAQNLSVDSVYFTTPFIKTNEQLTLQIKLTNHGSTLVEGLVVKVILNQVQKSLLNVNIGAGESVITSANFTLNNADWQQGEVSIVDYPVTYDDKLYFSFKPTSQYKILNISNTSNPFINAVYANDNQYAITQNTFGNINYQEFDNYSLIIINEPTEVTSGLINELNNYLQQGGQVLLIPPAVNCNTLNNYALSLGLPIYGNAVKQPLKVNTINTQHVIFKNVFKKQTGNIDFPSVSNYYPLQKQSNTKGRGLITLNNGDNLLWQASVNKGNVYQLALPLNASFSNLQQHSLFVPMMLNMAVGMQNNKPLYYVIKQSKQAYLPNNLILKQKLVELKNTQQSLITEPFKSQGALVVETDAINTQGWFNVTPKDDKNTLAIFAFNNSRNESSMQFLSENDIKNETVALVKTNINTSKSEVLGAQISSELSGKQLWRWFIALALIMLLAEILLIRLMH